MRLGFIADIHEDTKSLQLAFDLLAEEGCEFIVCLGDIVGFNLTFQKYIENRDANKCLALVQKSCNITVAGNHDLYAVKRVPVHNAGFNYLSNWYEIDYDVRAKLSKNKIWLYEDSELPNIYTRQSTDFLHSLEEYSVKNLGGINFLFSHFNYPDLTGSTINFPKKTKDLKKHFKFMKDNNCTIGISGHGHPEGCAIVTENCFEFRPFGTYKLNNELQWVVCPCVANTTRSNGVTTLDTDTLILKIIPLQTPKIIV